ncbi:MAG TPA: C-GCAxxG-C-C family protein [Dissulfurispiraceae bacterium]|nr:C-GCAxxG-C-C family protein [Dissulfurispiraceae bacterium]
MEKKADMLCLCKRRDFLKASLLTVAAFAGGTGLVSQADAASHAGSRPERAVAHFMKSMNCSQAIFETYAPLYGLDEATARRVGTPFAGGMGIGSECGAVTGALLVIGLKSGNSHKKTFASVEQLQKQFKAQHGSTGCSQLLGVDMSTPAGVKKAEKAGYFTSRCPLYVRTAADILEKILV